jgi:hypothetical protein
MDIKANEHNLSNKINDNIMVIVLNPLVLRDYENKCHDMIKVMGKAN